MKWTINIVFFFLLLIFVRKIMQCYSEQCLKRYNQRNWNLFFSLEFIVHFITLIAYPPFNGLLSIYSVASFCQLVSLFPVFLLFFLLSIVFIFSQKLWNLYAINLYSCFRQSFVCLLQAHFHCRSRLYYWLNEISITKNLHRTRPRSICNGKKQSATTFLLISWEPFKKT